MSKSILPVLLILALALLACSLTPQMPTAGEAAEPFPTERIPSPTLETIATAMPEPITCRVTAAEALHMRDAAGIDAVVIAWLFAGEQLTLSPTPPAGVWVEVVTAEGVHG